MARVRSEGRGARMARIWTGRMAVLLGLLFGLITPVSGAGNAETPNGQAAPVTESPSPERVFEAIQGYIRGMHQAKGPGDKSSPLSPERRWSGTRMPQDDPEPRRQWELDEMLAKRRIGRQEWDLALHPLERAIRSSVRVASADERAELERWNQAAKARTQEAPGPATMAQPTGEITNAIGMRFVGIPAGTFIMGSTSAEVRRVRAEWDASEDLMRPEDPAHTVRISKPFLMGKYEVTVGQFKRFVSETGYRTVAERHGWGWVYDEGKKHWVKLSGVSWRNPGMEVSDDYPVVMVCHEDADAFCQWLSKKDSRRYALPTEAQWEYAARGGKDGLRFPWGEEYPDGKKLNSADRRSPVPWADRTLDDGSARLAPVGSFQPNGFWLYDMAGNAWELCADFFESRAYEVDKSGTLTDPTGPARTKKRAVRGGNWAFGAGIARNAFRFGLDLDLCTDLAGFRVVADAGYGEVPQAKPAGDSGQTGEHFSALVEKIKDLVAAGKKIEARKLASQSGNGANVPKGQDDVRASLKEVLESLIDLADDKSQESFANSLGMRMIRIPAGAFVMGSSEMDIAWAMGTLAQGQPVQIENEFPFHKVRITRPFFIASTEVTVSQFRRFVEATGYITDAEAEGGGQVFNVARSRFERKEGTSWRTPGWTVTDDQAVAMVSHDDAVAFCEWLTSVERLVYKLPTEAQWEYAARGGLPFAAFPWGDALPDGERANYADRNTDYEWRDRTTDDGYKFVAPVGKYKPNGFGLYDMAGNVLEWTRDYYGEDYYRYAPEVDPEGPGHGENRVTKGGEWLFGPVNLRCAFRGWSRPDLAFANTGFRVMVELSSPTRPFAFANDFLTKEWVPGQDQRAVATAVAKDQERQRRAPTASGTPKNPVVPPDTVTLVRGLEIVSLTPKSDARKAGLALGDVIIEYNSERDLTAERLIALTAATKRDRIRPLVIFVREGVEYSVRAAPGFLGITVTDTTLRGPFKKPATQPVQPPERKKDDKAKGREWT